MSAKFLTLIAMISLSQPALALNQCIDLLKVEQRRTLSQDDVLQLQQRLTFSLRDRSRNINSTIHSGEALETVVIGAGLHGSIFAASAAQRGVSEKVMVVDAGDVISSVFGNLDGTFRINSSEKANFFPGSPVQQKDLSVQRFATSLDLGTLATAAAYSSRVPVLFNNKVVSVYDLQWRGEAAPGRYKITFENGNYVYANKVVAALGLGKISFPFQDPATKQLAETWLMRNFESPEQLQSIMTVDTLLSMLKLRTVIARKQRSRFTLAAETRGKEIAVIGSGDGGKIAVESLLDKAPLPGNVTRRGKDIFADDLTVHWIGQDAATPAAYRASTWQRYLTVAEDIGARVQTYSGRLTKMRELADGRIELTYGDNQVRIVDYVILATGYQNLIPSLVSNLNGALVDSSSVRMEPVIHGGTAIGSRVVVEGAPEQNIYVIGPAAGPIKTKEELQSSITGNPVAVENLGPGSAAMVEIAGGRPSTLTNLGRSNLAFSYRLAEPPANQTYSRMGIDELVVSVKLEMHRSLLNVRSSEPLILSVNNNAGLGSIVVTGLSRESADGVANRLSENQDLLQALGKLVDRNQSLSVRVPTRDGILRFDQADFILR